MANKYNKDLHKSKEGSNSPLNITNFWIDIILLSFDIIE